MPDVGKYPRRQIIVTTNPNNHGSQSQSEGRSRRISSINDGGIAERDQSQTLAPSSQQQYFPQPFERPHPTLMARGLFDLLPADRSAYELEVRLRAQVVRDIKEKRTAISKLRTWVEESISDHLWTTCCKAEDTTRDWYIGLKTSVCADAVHLRSKARDRYQRAIQPLKKIPQDFEAWIKEWKEAFAYAKTRDVADVARSADWLKDISKAVKDVLPGWGSSFRNGHLTAIRSDTLDYKEVAASLYDEADIQNLLKRQHPRVTKGAFGPTFGPESDRDLDESQDQEKDQRKDQRKGRKRKAKKGDGNENGPSKKKRDEKGQSNGRGDSDSQRHNDDRDIENCYVCATIASFFTGCAPHSAFAITQYPLKNSALLDSATTLHIFNEISRFNNFRAALPGDYVTAGDHLVPIQGYGDVDIKIQGQRGFDLLRLRDVAFCENFAANLVSLRQLQKHGYWWDNRLGQNCIRAYNGKIICKVLDRHDQFVLENIPRETSRQSFFNRRNTFNSWTGRRPSSVDARKWHLRLGHPGPQALEHLVNCSTGARIKGLTTVACDHCGVSKAKRQVSRKPRDRGNAPGQRLAIDFHDLDEDHEGRGSAMLVTDRWSGYIWDFYLTDRKAETIKEALEILFGILDRRYQIKPRVIECDNEIYEKKQQVRNWLESLFILIEPSAAYTQAQNGGAERSGGVIETKARTMRTGARLPNYLWVEIFKAAVYIYNRTPIYIHKWQSPYDRFFTFLASRDGVTNRHYKPDQGHLRVYGCKAFAMTKDAMAGRKRRQKLNPRAWIGYIVGYQSTNIYRIWNPLLGKTISTRDVIFNEDDYFNGDLEQLKDDIRELDREELINLLQEIKEPEPEPIEETSYEELPGEDDLVFGVDNEWDMSMNQRVDDQTREGNLGPEAMGLDAPSWTEDHPNMRVAPSVTEDPHKVPCTPGSGESHPSRIDVEMGVTDRIDAMSGTQHLLSEENPNISPHGGTQQRQDANGWETSLPSMPPDTRMKADAEMQSQLYPTPSLTASPSAALMAACFQGSTMNLEAQYQDSDFAAIELQSTIPADIQKSLNTHSSVETWKAAFAAGRHAAPIGTVNGKQIDRAKFLRMLAQPTST
ncbi:hypothetical protein HIM_10077 [Hirsutella minnesotensis 3608]|uniref:Integrase catalytic domain-containing protein n=1 Tax=Hirsutella minnesotensis 3608 TaxID=1043627 RepID=A0A0F7ZS07_9HYPO|nr:hypothetical protein HIM_10077 [Hirsutella minnesotensis 3608]